MDGGRNALLTPDGEIKWTKRDHAWGEERADAASVNVRLVTYSTLL
jgi:hypothetical protein